MRPLVQPPPSLRCKRCGGELRLKRIEPADPTFDQEKEVFACAGCGRVQSYTVTHDHYAPRARTG